MARALRFGTVEWAAAKAATACRHGMSATRRDCHAKAGNWIRENADLAADPSCRLLLFSLPSGLIAHAAISVDGSIIHDEADIGFTSVDRYRLAAEIPAHAILKAAMAEPTPEPKPLSPAAAF
jgi:hypothetical protein